MVWRIGYEDHEDDGIAVRIDHEADERCLGWVIESLDLIKEVDRRTYRLIQRLLSGGIVVAMPRRALAWYEIKRKACFLNLDYVATYPAEDIALSIVHETCHARLGHFGIG